MINIKISHNGKEYKDISKAFEAAMKEEIENIIKARLTDIYSEVERENGRFIVKSEEGSKITVTWEGFSDELTKKIDQRMVIE